MAQYTKHFTRTERDELNNFIRYLKINDYTFTFDGINLNVTIQNITYSTFQTIVSEAGTFHTKINGVMGTYLGNVGGLFKELVGFDGASITPLSADDRRTELKRRVSVYLDNIRTNIITTGGYSEGEALGWADKIAIAERILAETATAEEIAGVEAEAAARQLGETATQLAQRQVDNAASLRAKRNLIDGVGKYLRTQLDSLTTGELGVIYETFDQLTADLEEL